MTRRTAFLCIGLLLVTAILPCAIVCALPLFDSSQGAVDGTGLRKFVAADVVACPLLERVTPRHLARASLCSFAA